MAVFALYVLDSEDRQIPASMKRATERDLQLTGRPPRWQTDWTSEYVTKSGFALYALKVSRELVALAAYEVRESSMGVHIVYMESQAESNPTMTDSPRYREIGRALVAYGIKLSVDAGFNGDVTLDAKTPELAAHYERDFGAVRLPGRPGGTAPHYLICDEAAANIFTGYLKGGT